MENKLYVGDLDKNASEKDLESAFSYYGPLKSVWVARNPAGFAFVEFDDYRDAEDAVRGLDGTTICNSRVRVEHSTGKIRSKPWLFGGGGGGGRGPPRGRRPFHSDDKCYQCGRVGHYAYDCPRKAGDRSGRSSRRSRSRSRSRSPKRRRRSPSRSRSRSRSPVKSKRSKSRSKSQDRTARKSKSRSKSQD